MKGALNTAVSTAVDTRSTRYQNNLKDIELFVSRLFKDKEPMALRVNNKNRVLSRDYLLDLMAKPFKYNSYVSVGSVKDIKKVRSAANVAQIKAITIDIDAHLHNFSKEELERIFKGLEMNGLYDYVPRPHFVSFTGRGLQLTYAIEPITMAKRKSYATELYKDSVKVLQNQMTKALNEMSFISDIEHLSVDKSVSAISQLVRIPGTWNEKANIQSEIIVNNSDLENITLTYIFEFKPIIITEKKDKSVFIQGNYQGLLEARVDDMFKLLEIRGQDRTDYGHRQSMLANYLYCALSLNEEISLHDLEKKAEIYNLGFSTPLSSNEVISTARHIVKYKEANPLIGNDSMINFLGITDEESKHMITFNGSEVEKKRRLNMKEETKKKREVARDRKRARTKIINYENRIKLINLVREDSEKLGMTNTELGEKYGVTARTIINYLNDDFVEGIAKPTPLQYQLREEEEARLLIQNNKKKSKS